MSSTCPFIVNIYCENYCPRRASVFLCYYVFTAAIMHVATRTSPERCLTRFRCSPGDFSPVRTYPDDPQGERGLEKCMSVLRRMSVTWPSAYRALELLTGARAQLARTSEAPSLRSVVSEPRLKRAADDSADREDVTVSPAPRTLSQEAYRAQSNYVVPSQPTSHSPQLPSPPHQHQPHPSQPQQQSSYLAMDLHSNGGAQAASTGYMSASYDRWAPDASALTGFNGSISTSVLPQQYSTGLVDSGLERAGGERTSARHPQYWNDYSALGQMETTYGVPVMGEMVSQHGSAHPHPHPHAQQQAHPMYVSEQYSMFGESAFVVFRIGRER